MRQASWIVRQGYMSLSGWMEQSLKVRRTSISDQSLVSEYLDAWVTVDKTEGWANKRTMAIYMEKRHNVSQNKFYRKWPQISDRFETKKMGKTSLVKLKEDEENESNI